MYLQKRRRSGMSFWAERHGAEQEMGQRLEFGPLRFLSGAFAIA
jgi:hypothetical protein